MEDGPAPDEDEPGDLEAVWGREASATAPPAPRPDLGSLFASPAGSAADPPRRGRGPVLGGLALAAVAALVAVVIALGGGDDPEADPGPAARPSSTATTGAPEPVRLGPPAWTAAAVCPRFEEAMGQGRTACLLATDDERAYVLVDVEGTQTLRALDVGTGQVRWEASFPEGVHGLERWPSVVAVGGVGYRPPTAEGPGTVGEVVALDPVTGEQLWGRAGSLVGAAGPDHLVLDASPPGSEQRVMSVVEADTGREVLRRESDGGWLSFHPCGATVLVGEGDRLTAHDVADGWPRWSIPAPSRAALPPVICDDRRIAYVVDGTLVLLEAGTAATIGGTRVTGVEDDSSRVLALVGDTVVVGSLDGARGFRADEGLEELWHLPCTQCGPDLPVGATPREDGVDGEEDVVVLIRNEAVVRDGVDGSPGTRLALDRGTTKVLAGGALLAWGRGAVTWVDPVGPAPPARIELEGVRAAAAGADHVVVATRDEVRAYHRQG